MRVLYMFIVLVLCGCHAEGSSRVERAASNCPPITNFSGRVKYRRKGTRAVFKCQKKFDRYGPRFATCQEDGTWSDEPPLCIRPGCLPIDPSQEPNLDLEVVNGALVRFKCLQNYKLLGAAEIYCDGKDWSAPLPRCAAPHELTECDFEQDFCGWTQDDTDERDWERNVGPTQTGNTGPKNDHTYGTSKNGHYIFFEASAPTMMGDTAKLLSPVYTPDLSPKCFDFWYHILGPDETGHVGSLEVYVIDQSQFEDEIQPLFVKEGNQGDQWNRGEIFIDKQDEPYQIMIVGKRALSYFSDIAVDDVRLYDCPTGSTKKPSKTTVEALTGSTTESYTESTTETTTRKIKPTKPKPPKPKTKATSKPIITTTLKPATTMTKTTLITTTAAPVTTLKSTSRPITTTKPTTKLTTTIKSTTKPITTPKSTTEATTTTKPQTKTTKTIKSTTKPITMSKMTTKQATTTLTTASKALTWSRSPIPPEKLTTSEIKVVETTEATSTRKKPTAKPAVTTDGISESTTRRTAVPGQVTKESEIVTKKWSSSRKPSSAAENITTLLQPTATTRKEPVSTTKLTRRTTFIPSPSSSLKMSITSKKPSTVSTTLTVSTESPTRAQTVKPTTKIQTQTTKKLTTSAEPAETTKTTASATTTTTITTTSTETTTTTIAKTTSSQIPEQSSTTTTNTKTSKSTRSSSMSISTSEKTPQKSTKRSNSLTTKASSNTINYTKDNSISASEQRSEHPEDDTLKPLMIGLGVGIVAGLIIIGVIAYVCVRRRKFYTSRYEDELKPITNSASVQSLNGSNGHFYQDEEYESES